MIVFTKTGKEFFVTIEGRKGVNEELMITLDIKGLSSSYENSIHHENCTKNTYSLQTFSQK